ncbi:DEAD/DEAH box helicase [Candidatus Saccharibacteria bacterium]|nr:DEAD/DEAH box helicase [Candidatus Saccharibacteria bacterium]NCU40422.1 DEAD/DEAH box helicase [Candidatus Saccharibacteria bacterium]
MQKKSYYGARNSRTNYQSRPQQRRQTSNIHPSKFVNRAVAREDVPYEPRHKFSDFALNPEIQRTLEYLELTIPTAIQDQAIVPILAGDDVIGLANTGTGKTAAFLLPIIEKLSKNPARNSVLVLTPTRELAQQIDEEFKRFSPGQKLYSTVCVGGANIGRQIRELQRNPHVIIATPGRLKDLIDRRVLVLSAVNTFVLDEADRMLDMGFIRDIQRVAEMLPNNRQTLCFSATLTPAIQKIMSEMMQDPKVISVRSGETSSHIDQNVVEVFDKIHKISVLEDMLREESFEKVLVFCETKYGAQRLADNLSKNNLPAVAIHGNKTQSQREKALKAFKTNAVKVMVATDVAARGLDIPNVSHVINFDQPKVYDDYIHRIGRTGRAGKTGKALTFVTARQ